MILNLPNLIQKYNLRISGLIHVGGHHGTEHQTYIDNGITNVVYFEPVKSNFEILKKNIQGSVAYNIALGSEKKETEMFIETANGGQSCSILEPALHLSQYPTIVFDGREIVEVDTMDNIFPELNGDFNMINMDVQGYELEVLKGSLKTLESIDYIMTEINRDEVYKNCAKISELISLLEPYGFFLVEENWAGDTWGDGFFIKK